MKKVFLVYKGKEYTYEMLLNDINSKGDYRTLIYAENNEPYQIFLSIIHSLINNYPVELIDGDFSNKEIANLGINKELFLKSKVEKKHNVNSFNKLLNYVLLNQDWTLTLYTSGTTGKPKKVEHNLETLTRNVKLDDRFKSDIWAFAYNPTHMAGLQVFFQAFLNLNTIIYAFDGEQKYLSELIKSYKITNISATSTYYRNVLPFLKGNTYESIKRVTFGGEKYDSSIEETIKTIFPNAKIRNIYASTEAGSLFVAKGDIFEIPSHLKKYIKINDSNELLIHQSLLGFSDTLILQSEWYKTGDLVEVVSQSQFRFLSRESDIINVGGYKVNSVDVENILINVPGVIDLLVKSKENSVTGQILVLDVVIDENFNEKELKKAIKKYAAEHLQKWKIPRIINFVDDIPQTRTGKKVRK